MSLTQAPDIFLHPKTDGGLARRLLSCLLELSHEKRLKARDPPPEERLLLIFFQLYDPQGGGKEPLAPKGEECGAGHAEGWGAAPWVAYPPLAQGSFSAFCCGYSLHTTSLFGLISSPLPTGNEGSYLADG